VGFFRFGPAQRAGEAANERMQETQGHPWYRTGAVQVPALAPFTSSCAGPALLILGR
jgi:hypothetical protein